MLFLLNILKQIFGFTFVVWRCFFFTLIYGVDTIQMFYLLILGQAYLNLEVQGRRVFWKFKCHNVILPLQELQLFAQFSSIQTEFNLHCCCSDHTWHFSNLSTQADSERKRKIGSKKIQNLGVICRNILQLYVIYAYCLRVQRQQDRCHFHHRVLQDK